MDADPVDQRLNQISTVWTLVRQAHGPVGKVRAEAQTAVLERYQQAIYRYILQAVNRNYDAADDVFQEFTLRFVRGDFKGADPGRGRFRDYVKRAVINLVIDNQKKSARQRRLGITAAEQLANVPAPVEDSDEEFLQHWRKALLDRAWEALAAEANDMGPPFFVVLRRMCEDAKLTAALLAEQLTAEMKPPRPFTESGIRKILQRARERFGTCLLAEVSRSLQTSDSDSLLEEVHALGFQMFCRKALGQAKG